MIVHRVADVVVDDMFLVLDDVVPGSDVFLKLEGLNAAGSVKLKTAVGLLDHAEAAGLLIPGGRVIESSSGNLGVALSVVCAERGYRFTCVCDPNVSEFSVAFMRATGAEVVVIDQRDRNFGYLESRIAYVHERLAADNSLVWLNQYANPANPAPHRTRTAPSIHAEIGHVDYLFAGAGTTGTLSGCVQYFRVHSPHTKIIAVDVVGSVTFGFPPGVRHIPGLGTSRRPELADALSVDRVVLVEESYAVRRCRELARSRGLVAGGSTGAVLSAIGTMSDDIPPGSRIVALSPDFGDRYLQTIYHDTWVKDRFDGEFDDACEAGWAVGRR